MERLTPNVQYLQGDRSDVYLDLIRSINHLDEEAIQKLQDSVMGHINNLYGDSIEENLRLDHKFAHLFENKQNTGNTQSQNKKEIIKKNYNIVKKSPTYKITNRTEPKQLLKKVDPKSKVIRKAKNSVLKNVADIEDISSNNLGSYVLEGGSDLLESSTLRIHGIKNKIGSTIQARDFQLGSKGHIYNTTAKNSTILVIMNQSHMKNRVIVKQNVIGNDLHYWDLNENIQQNEIYFSNSDFNEKNLHGESSGIKYLPNIDTCETETCKKINFQLVDCGIEIDKNKKPKKTYSRKQKLITKESDIFVKEVDNKSKIRKSQPKPDIEKYLKTAELKKDDRYKYYSGGHIKFCKDTFKEECNYNFENLNVYGKHKDSQKNTKFTHEKQTSQFPKQKMKYKEPWNQTKKSCNFRNKVVVENIPINNLPLDTDIFPVNPRVDFNFNKISSVRTETSCERTEKLENRKIQKNIMLVPEKGMNESFSNNIKKLGPNGNSKVSKIQCDHLSQENQKCIILPEKLETAGNNENVEESGENMRRREIIEIHRKAADREQSSKINSEIDDTQHSEVNNVDGKQNLLSMTNAVSLKSFEMKNEKAGRSEEICITEKRDEFQGIVEFVDSDQISHTQNNDNNVDSVHIVVKQEGDRSINNSSGDNSKISFNLHSNEVCVNNEELGKNYTFLKDIKENYKCIIQSNEEKFENLEENLEMQSISKLHAKTENSKQEILENLMQDIVNKITEKKGLSHPVRKTDPNEFEENLKSDTVLKEINLNIENEPNSENLKDISEANLDMQSISGVNTKSDKSENSKPAIEELVNKLPESDCISQLVRKNDLNEYEENFNSDSFAMNDIQKNITSFELDSAELGNVQQLDCKLKNSNISKRQEKESLVEFKIETVAIMEQCELNNAPNLHIKIIDLKNSKKVEVGNKTPFKETVIRRKSLRNKSTPTITENNSDAQILVKITYDKDFEKGNKNKKMESNNIEDNNYSAGEKKGKPSNESFKGSICYNLRSKAKK